MKLRTITSDGTEQADVSFELTIKDSDGNPYDPPVTIVCRPILGRQRREIEKVSERWVPGPRGRGKVKEPDQNAAAAMVVQQAIVSWEGILGSDGQPLICTDATKEHLPEHVKVQVIEAALSSEEAGQPESFRQLKSVV